MVESARARVFISCGQNKLNDEAQIAKDIALRLDKLGYDPYVATQEQTLIGLRDNIFEKLANSEYFLLSISLERNSAAKITPNIAVHCFLIKNWRSHPILKNRH